MIIKSKEEYWILSVYFTQQEIENGKILITLKHGYFDGYKMPNIQRWLFDDENKALTAKKFLKMIELGNSYKSNFNRYVNENCIRAIPSIMDTYV